MYLSWLQTILIQKSCFFLLCKNSVLRNLRMKQQVLNILIHVL